MENKGTSTKRQLSEIEAAKLLVQLSSGDSEEDPNCNKRNYDESFARTNKRYRYINEELYRVTTPLSDAVKLKAMIIKRINSSLNN